MMEDCQSIITLSLQELIASGCLSESTFLLDHEIDDDHDINVDEDGMPNSNSSNTSRDDRSKRLRHLNAAKISYLLAKSVSDRPKDFASSLLSAIASDNNNNNNNNNNKNSSKDKNKEDEYASSIIVRFKCSSLSSTELDARCPQEQEELDNENSEQEISSVDPTNTKAVRISDLSLAASMRGIEEDDDDDDDDEGPLMLQIREVSENEKLSLSGAGRLMNTQRRSQVSGSHSHHSNDSSSASSLDVMLNDIFAAENDIDENFVVTDTDIFSGEGGGDTNADAGNASSSSVNTNQNQAGGKDFTTMLGLKSVKESIGIHRDHDHDHEHSGSQQQQQRNHSGTTSDSTTFMDDTGGNEKEISSCRDDRDLGLGIPKMKTRIPICSVSQFRDVDRANMRKLRCTLIAVDVVCNLPSSLPTSATTIPANSKSRQEQSATMRLLGNLMYTVFSQNEEGPLSSLLPLNNGNGNSTSPGIVVLDDADASSVITSTSSSVSYLPIRQSKARRNIDKTLFTTLVESGRYPISICRFLSDILLINAGNTAGSGRYNVKKGDAPFSSVDEVIDDLEQMVLHPQVFLYQTEKVGMSLPNLLFGQRHYGRVSEVTKILEISTRLEEAAKKDENEGDDGDGGAVETLYISGAAGSGKTHLTRKAGTFLSILGWIVIEKKFYKEEEHTGGGAVTCSILENLVCQLVDMKHGSNQANAKYAQRAEKAILDTFDNSNLQDLADMIPSVCDFVNDFGMRTCKMENEQRESSEWHKTILISKLMGAILKLDRFLLIFLDDLQWADTMMLAVVKETILAISQDKDQRRRLFFVGTYRHDEVDCDHPLTRDIGDLQRSDSVNVTQMKLSSLSMNDVCDMVMTEMQLPRRLVVDLARVIHKKTSGHAIFITELLNSLLRDSTIAYSPQKHRLDWDQDIVSSIKTGEDVASLIISKLTSLKPASLWTLCVLSCFGFKAEVSLLRFLQGSALIPGEGFDLTDIVEEGFVELSGPVVIFTHDLIQQHVYEKMPVQQRQKLHLNIGTFLSTKTMLDSSPLNRPSIESGMEQLYICDGGDDQDDDSPISILSLAGIATNQINKAGTNFISDPTQRVRFAGWNLHSANESAAKSNFRAALYYSKNGISFLGKYPWLSETCQLSLELHEGAAFALFAVNVEDVAHYANAIIDAENVEFEQTLAAQYILLRSLESLGDYADSTARGLAVLRRLGFDIPAAPSPGIVLQAMAQTSIIASQYNFGQMPKLPKVIPTKQKNVLKIIDSVAVGCFRSTSPYLPLVACATVTYSLQHGIFHCEEAASAFIIFGYFKLFLEQKFDEGQQWGNLAIAIIGNSYGNVSCRARVYLFGFLYYWYIPIKETCRRLYETYTIGMRCGDVDSAMYALGLDWRCQFYGGEKLSVVKANYEEYMKSLTKYHQDLAIHAVLKKKVLNMLMGIEDEDPFSALGGTIRNEKELLMVAESQNNIQLVEAAHMTQFLSGFWMGDFEQALEASKVVMSLASFKMLKFHTIYFTFYRGIVLYRLFREGEGSHLLDEGNEVLSKVQTWSQTCRWVENKVLLLQAEYFASRCNRNLAKEKYDASIKSARDHGFLHEQGLAHECMGIYLSSIVEIPEAKRCFWKANECYTQWGASNKAAQIRRDHGLDPNDAHTTLLTTKHVRDCDEVIGIC